MRICCFYAKIRSSEKFQTTFDSRKSLTGGESVGHGGLHLAVPAIYTHIFRMILNVKNKTKNGFGIFMLPVAFRSLG